MNRHACVAVLLSLLAFPAGATSTLYTDGLPVEVGLVGGDFSPAFNGTIEADFIGNTGSRTLPPRTYRMDGYRYKHRFRLRFDNPRHLAGQPPSFTLDVCGNRAVMTIDGKRHVGCFAWEDDGGGCNGQPPSKPVETRGCPAP